MEGTISIRQYAKSRGCSDTAVHKAIRSGKIVEGRRVDDSGRPWIIPEIADREWKSSREIGTSKSAAIDKKIGATTTKATAAVKQSKTEPEPPNQDGGLVQQMNKAKVVRATAQAQMAQLDYKKKAGILVEKAAVYNALFTAGREIRAAIMNIPDRYIDEIVAAQDRNRAHTILTQAIAEALESVSGVEKREIV
jgi:hypothetical protein